MDAEAERLEAASLACIDRMLATTEAILALLQQREAEEGATEEAGVYMPGTYARKRARGADVSNAAGAAPVAERRAPPDGRSAADWGPGVAYPRGRPKPSQGRGRSVFAGPAGRRHDTTPSAAVVVIELREHASRIGVPLPADCGPAPTTTNLRGDDAAARSMLTTYVEVLEAAFGGDIYAAPRGMAGSFRSSHYLLHWLWTVPAASSSVVAAAAVATTRLAAVARAARDADADTLLGRLRRCVPVGRGFDKAPSAVVVMSELREHASRIGVPLPAACEPAPAAGYLRGDNAAARSMLTAYVEMLEAAFGSDVCAVPRDGRNYHSSYLLLNWLWTVPAATASVTAAAAVAATRLAAAARAARDADADTLSARLRRCVPIGRGFDKAPSATVIVSELHEHATRIGVALPVVGISAPSLGRLTGDDAAARLTLATYVEMLEAAFGRDIIAAPRHSGGRRVGATSDLLNWLWAVPAAAAAGSSSSGAAATAR